MAIFFSFWEKASISLGQCRHSILYCKQTINMQYFLVWLVLIHHLLMSVFNPRQWVGMFNLQCLGVKLWTCFFLKIFTHFVFFGIFTEWILIKYIWGKVCGLVWSPVFVACFLLTGCPAKVLDNLRRKQTDSSEPHTLPVYYTRSTASIYNSWPSVLSHLCLLVSGPDHLQGLRHQMSFPRNLCLLSLAEEDVGGT